ncbi:hypothetical protein A7C99_5837 [Trichophyton rubrum]|uniref:Uncharacterized protein n=1 Tax=Trichophyton rubrum TaxID=5551 RepID=A0A178EVP4_TRIRU|nr:hypothetical protein A7C99_5837 [Trichophyton rubrum]
MDVLLLSRGVKDKTPIKRDSGGGQREDVLWTVDAGQGHGHLAEGDARERVAGCFPAAFDGDGRGQLLMVVNVSLAAVRSKSRTWADGAKVWLVRESKKGCGGAALPANP